MDPRPDPPRSDHDERERLRRLEGSSRSPLQGGNFARALRAISIALALLGLAALWFVSMEQKRQAEEQAPVAAPATAATATAATAVKPADTSPAADASKPNPVDTRPHSVGSFDRERARPLDRDRPDGR